MNVSDLVKDWDGFEKLVAELHQTGSVSVEHNVTLSGRSGAPRQVDVVIRHKRDLYEFLVIAECKYWNTLVDRAAIDVLAKTRDEVGASRAVMFSSKGFQTGAVAQAKAENIELFTVRDLSDEEWGLPGRVVDFYLQVIQPSFGNFRIATAVALNPPANFDSHAPVNVHLELGRDTGGGRTPTFLPDGQMGLSLEAIIEHSGKDALRQFTKEAFTLNGGADCTRYMMGDVNLAPPRPFEIEIGDVRYWIPKVTYSLGIKIAQSRFTHDRAAHYKFALALHNCVTGSVVGASKRTGDTNTQLVDIVTAQQDAGDTLKNGSVLRVFLNSYFPFEEMRGLEPAPLGNGGGQPIIPVAR